MTGALAVSHSPNRAAASGGAGPTGCVGIPDPHSGPSARDVGVSPRIHPETCRQILKSIPHPPYIRNHLLRDLPRPESA